MLDAQQERALAGVAVVAHREHAAGAREARGRRARRRAPRCASGCRARAAAARAARRRSPAPRRPPAPTRRSARSGARTPCTYGSGLSGKKSELKRAPSTWWRPSSSRSGSYQPLVPAQAHAERLVEGELRRDQHDLLVGLGDEEHVEIDDRRQRRAVGRGQRLRLLAQLRRGLRGQAPRALLETRALREHRLLVRREHRVAEQLPDRIREIVRRGVVGRDRDHAGRPPARRRPRRACARRGRSDRADRGSRSAARRARGRV